jgi:four helix bundle protein
MFSNFAEAAVSGLDGQLVASIEASAIQAGLLQGGRELIPETHHDDGMELRESSHNLMLAVHRETLDLPAKELNGITAELRNAAVQIGTSISEGLKQDSPDDFGKHLRRALEHALQLEYLLLRACELGYLESAVHAGLATQVDETRRLVAGFIQDLHGSRTATGG